MNDRGTDRPSPRSWWIFSSAFVSALVALTCGVILWTFLPPVVLFPFFALAAWVLLILGIVWLVFAAIGWFKYRALRWSAVAPVLVLLTVALVLFSVPSRLAFVVSETSLTAAAAECRESQAASRIGVYTVLSIEAEGDGGCLFFIDGGLIDSIGLAYIPNGTPYLGNPRFDGDIGFEEYDGDWYRFVRRF